MSISKRVSRRGFIKGAAAAGAAIGFPTIIPASAIGADGTVAPSNRVVLGAIGVGWQGTDNLRAFLYRDDVQIVAICDIEEEHSEPVQFMVNSKYKSEDCVVYKKFEDIIARGDIDAMSIALPDHWHAIPAIACAEANIDVYGEKPLSHNLKDGRAMVDAMHRHGRVWQTGSWQRSEANFHRACELVRNGRIGKVHTVEVGLGRGHEDYEGTAGLETAGPPPATLDFDRWLGPAPESPYCPARVHKNWRWVKDHGGGTLMDWIGHHGDIAHWGLGFDYTGPVEVEGKGVYPEDTIWDSATEYDCWATYANGVKMHISSEFPSSTRWIGEEGSIFVSRGSLRADRESILDEVIGENETHLYKSEDHHGDFISCVKSRKLTSTPIEVAHRSASVGHLCDIAMETGRKIRWNPETEEIGGDAGASELLGEKFRSPWKQLW
jgi:predicted dehydrogenase